MMVKICGITTRVDAVAATEAGATALGFNFCPWSPRYVRPSQAGEFGSGLAVLKVGVFVDSRPSDVAEAVRLAGLDIVQLHGSEDPRVFAPQRVWKACRVDVGWSPGQVNGTGAEAILLDGPAPGSGRSFDWRLAQAVRHRIILAGGLGPDNVREAVRQVRPWGVDACSRLEESPGRKDSDKVKRFIEAAMLEMVSA